MATKVIAIFILSILINSSKATAMAKPSPYEDFLRSKCASTLYPSLCFHSLLRFSPQIQTSQIYLALISANLSLAHVTSLSSHVGSLASSPSLSQRDRFALRDCKDAMTDAADLVKQSVEEIGRLETAVGPEVAWRVSNAQTWMSAAITNEDTCMDGFGEGGGGGVRDDVCGRVLRARMFCSVALALVNALVNAGW